MSTTYKSIINHLREGNIDQRELNSLEDGLERSFKRIEDLENESYKNNEQKEEMQAHIDCLKAELAEIQMNKQELPLEPIEVATMLVKATITRKTTPLQKAFNANLPDEYEADRYSDEDLCQIATHLLVYCNHAEVE